MACTIQWRQDGAVKYFTGEVSFEDVIKSEREITGSSTYTALKYVISMYLNTRQFALTDCERQEVRGLRLGGYYSNPRIKYAFVTQDLELKNRLEKSVQDGHTLHATRVFKTFSEAFTWAVT